jgi:hypothetical protein
LAVHLGRSLWNTSPGAVSVMLFISGDWVSWLWILIAHPFPISSDSQTFLCGHLWLRFLASRPSFQSILLQSWSCSALGILRGRREVGSTLKGRIGVDLNTRRQEWVVDGAGCLGLPQQVVPPRPIFLSSFFCSL